MEESEGQPESRLEGQAPESQSAFEAVPMEEASSQETTVPGMIGLTIGEYVVESELGRGGMGVVYRARQLSLDRPVAMKVLAAGLCADEEYVNRFLREARAAAQLNHPNVIQVFDAGVQDGVYFFVMEFAEGKDLGVVLKERKHLKESEALFIIQEAAKGLAFAHQKGVVHRDIKPGNIMLLKGTSVKIGDLGLAKYKSRADENTLTIAGTMMGTPYYICPEQIRGQIDIDGRADVYSLGMTLYHLLSGKPPFWNGSGAEIMAQHLSEEVNMENLPPEITEGTRNLIEGMIAKDRKLRIQTMQEVVDEIGGILGQKPVKKRASRELRSKDKADSIFTRSLPGWVTAVFLLVTAAVVGGIAWKLNSQKIPLQEQAAKEKEEDQPLAAKTDSHADIGKDHPVRTKNQERPDRLPQEKERALPPANKPSSSQEGTARSSPSKARQISISPNEIFQLAQNGNAARIKELMAQGIKFDIQDAHHRTPLMCAAFYGHLEAVEIIASKSDINQLDDDGMNALMYAVQEVRNPVVSFLIKNGANVNQQNQQGRSALIIATLLGKEELVQILVEANAKLDLKDNDGMAALLIAIKGDLQASAELLIKRGANLNVQEKRGNTPLFFALNAKNSELIKLLIEQKADVNLVNEYGNSPLITAIESGQPEIAEFLMEHHADLEIKNKMGETALFCALRNEQDKLVHLLIQNQANLENVDGYGRTPLRVAVENGKVEWAEIFFSAQRKSLNTADNKGITPLMKAVALGRETMVNWLIEKGADLRVKDQRGANALFFAAYGGQDEHVRILDKLLLKRSVDIDARDDQNHTALMVAAQRGNDRIVRSLIRFGASKNGAMEAAQAGGSMQVQQTLREAGLR